MTWPRRLVLAVLVCAFSWGLAATSALSVPWHGATAAKLRLSWVARPERIERCRTLSAAEMAERPAHMRQERECIGASATYRLRIAVDGAQTADLLLEGGGLRKDRAIFALDEFAVQPGRRQFEIQFTRVEPAEGPMDSTDVRRGAVARNLVLDTIVNVPGSSVALVSLVNGRMLLRLP